MDKRDLVQERIAEVQRLFFDILNTVHYSEYPITLESIAYLARQPLTPHFVDAVNALVVSGYIKICIREGIVNYQNPSTMPPTFLPLPYYLMIDNF